jgi:hypothetical protein
MKHAVGMGPGAMIYIPSFVKIGSAIQKLLGGDTQTQHRDHISIHQFCNTKESRQKCRCHKILTRVCPNSVFNHRRRVVSI